MIYLSDVAQCDTITTISKQTYNVAIVIHPAGTLAGPCIYIRNIRSLHQNRFHFLCQLKRCCTYKFLWTLVLSVYFFELPSTVSNKLNPSSEYFLCNVIYVLKQFLQPKFTRAINFYWSVFFSSVSTGTVKERFCLISNLSWPYSGLCKGKWNLKLQPWWSR
jgi:hypothetical protein